MGRVLVTAAFVVAIVGTASHGDDLDTVATRIKVDAYSSALSATTTNTYLNSLGADGRWADVNYADTSRTNWGPNTHLTRMLAMAQAHANPAHALYQSPTLLAGVRKAYDAFVALDPRSTNWWYNEIWTPQVIGKTVLLVQPQLTAAQITSGTAIIARSYIPRSNNTGTNTGENRQWRALATVLRGAITRDSALTSEAFGAISDTFVVTSGEGIQPDGSFHQHGPQLNNGSYGLSFSQDAADLSSYAVGTTYAMPAGSAEVLADYLLDGQQWMIRGVSFEATAQGRGISRSSSRNLGNGMASVIDQTMTLTGTYRAAELTAMRNRLGAAQASGTASPALALAGHKHFWRSDYTAHHRPGFSATVKVSSTRTLEPESGNFEGLKNLHLADGVNLIQQRGDEYTSIQPIWDWRRLPGTTIEQGTYSLKPSVDWGVEGSSGFAGGVSDGRNGATVLDYSRLNVKARKSWLFFDDVQVALGAGIDAAAATAPVITTLNQTFQKGSVSWGTTSGTTGTLTSGTQAWSDVSWVVHDGVGYVFPTPQSVTARAAVQSGLWTDLATSNTSSTLVSGSVFSLQVNHGMAPSGGSYAYAILPGASGSSVAAYAAAPAVRILANTRTLQAARHDGLALTQAAFYVSGTLSTGSGATLTVREPSLVMLDESTAATKLSVSNPNGLATTIHADVARTRPEGPDEFTRVTLRLSGSDQGGATVSRTFDQPAVRTFTYQLRDGAAAVAPLVYQWSFEGATAGERLQNSGTGANATLQAVAYGSEGSTAKIAYGLGVDETTTAMSPQRLGRLSANAGGALLTTSGTVVIPTAFTVEALVRPDLMETGGSIGYAVMAGGAATNNRGYFVVSQEGAATDSTSTIIGDSLSQADNVGRTIAAFVPGHWYYVANTYTVSGSQTTINSYVADLTAGQMLVTQAVANQVASGRPLTAAQMAIGGYFASGTAQEAWSGSIDEVSLFGRVLTAAEVQGRLDKLYQAPTQVSWSAAASGTALGGSGTWSALGKRWVSGTTRLLPVTTARLVFGGSAGTVAVTGSHAVGGGIAFTTGGYTLTGGTLSFTGDEAANMVNVLAGDSATLAATISGTGGMTKTGPGTLTLTGTNSYAGTTTVADGILTITSTAALPGYASAGRVSVADGGTLAVTNAVADAAVASILNAGNLAPGATFGFDTAAGNRTYPSALSASFGVAKLGTNTLTLSGSQSYTGPTTISGGTLAFTFGRNQTLAGPITGPGSLAKSGSGALLLTASNSHAGGTLITGGTLQIGAGGTTGWISGAVSNDGALAFHRSDDVVFSDAISGSGSVVQAGGGRLTLSGSNTYAGGTLITGTGSLAVAAAAALGSGTITLRTDQASFNPVLALTSGMTLPNPIVLAQTAANRNNIRTAGTTTLGGPITITGTGVGSNVFQNDASGQLTIAGDLSAPASYSGALSFRYGRILITGTINAPSATFNLNNGGTTIVSSTGNTWASLSFSGASTANLLQLGADDALATDAAVAFNPDSSGGGIDMNGFNQTLPGFYNATGTNPAPLNRIFNDGGSNATLTLAGLTANRWSNVALADGTGGGTLAFVMNSAGRMQTLASATSSYTGGTTIVAGTLALGHANALGGGGRLAVNGGTLDLAGSSPTVGALSGSSGGLITSGSAGASAVLTVSSAVNSTFAGRIQNGVGTVGLVKTGAGSLTLTGSNTYTGPTFVSAGTLAIFGNQSAATGAVTVASGAALGGTGTVGGATTIQSGATLSPGASPGTLTFTQGLTWNGGGTYTWQVLDAAGTAGTSGGWDLASVAGTLTIASTAADPFKINLWSLSGISPDVSGSAANFDPTRSATWRIANATGGITGFSADKFRITTGATNGTGGFANDTARGTFSLALSGSTGLDLVFTPVTTLTWHGDGVNPGGSGAWTTTGTNWFNGQDMGRWVPQATAVFSGTAGTVTVGGGVTVGAGMQFTTPGYAVSVASGTLVLASGSVSGSPALAVSAGGLVSLPADRRELLNLAALAVDQATGGKLDIGAGRITVAPGGIAEADLRADLIAGRGTGSFSGTSGIMTTGPKASAGSTNPVVGYRVLASGTAIVAWAAAGDANLDGVVNSSDVTLINTARLYGKGNVGAAWSQGDFTYSGSVNSSDVQAMLSAQLYGKGSYLPVAPGGMLAMALATGGTGSGLLWSDAGLKGNALPAFAAVPEPGGLVLAGMGIVAAAWAARRHRNT